MVIQFGKYKGFDIRDVPLEYLEWLLGENDKTGNSVRAEMERRRQVEDADMSMVEMMVKTGFRELAKRYHPDVGGDPEKMRELLGANEQVKEILEHYGFQISSVA